MVPWASLFLVDSLSVQTSLLRLHFNTQITSVRPANQRPNLKLSDNAQCEASQKGKVTAKCLKSHIISRTSLPTFASSLSQNHGLTLRLHPARNQSTSNNQHASFLLGTNGPLRRSRIRSNEHCHSVVRELPLNMKKTRKLTRHRVQKR